MIHDGFRPIMTIFHLCHILFFPDCFAKKGGCLTQIWSWDDLRKLLGGYLGNIFFCCKRKFLFFSFRIFFLCKLNVFCKDFILELWQLFCGYKPGDKILISRGLEGVPPTAERPGLNISGKIGPQFSTPIFRPWLQPLKCGLNRMAMEV